VNITPGGLEWQEILPPAPGKAGLTVLEMSVKVLVKALQNRQKLFYFSSCHWAGKSMIVLGFS
jgi:hypothetical protein